MFVNVSDDYLKEGAEIVLVSFQRLVHHGGRGTVGIGAMGIGGGGIGVAAVLVVIRHLLLHPWRSGVSTFNRVLLEFAELRQGYKIGLAAILLGGRPLQQRCWLHSWFLVFLLGQIFLLAKASIMEQLFPFLQVTLRFALVVVWILLMKVMSGRIGPGKVRIETLVLLKGTGQVEVWIRVQVAGVRFWAVTLL